MKITTLFSKWNKSKSLQNSFYLIALFLLLSDSILAQVTLPHYDGLNYTVGQGLQSQTGWTSLNSGDDLAITSGSLIHPLGTQTGNKVAFAGDGIDAAKSFTQQTSGTVYWGFLLNVASLGSLDATGGYFAGFTEGANTTFGATVWTRLDGTGYDIGINPRTTAANTVWSTGTQTVGTTLLIVIGYEMVAGTANDVVSLWISPDPNSTMPPTPTLTATNTGGTDLANVNRILIRQDSQTETPSIEMDEFRIGTSWVQALPITLKSFTATPRNKQVQIDFTTATEANNSHFNIQRSADGSKYDNIGRVQGNGTTAQEHSYTFIDESPLVGVNYYRLHQVDFDGKSSYSPVVSVNFGKVGVVYNVYPNPAGDLLHLRFEAETEAEMQIRLTDLTNRVLLQKTISAEEGYNEVQLELAGLPAGIYTLQLTDGVSNFIRQVIKQ